MATMDPESEYCLRWKKYELNFRTFFADLYQNDALVDVSLVTQEGSITSAHRVVLSACSPYFQNIFKTIPNHPHPVIVLKDVSAADLQSILCFMYKGTVNVLQNRVNGIIAMASSLQVKGLSAAPTPPVAPISPDISGITPPTFATLGTNANNPTSANNPALKPITTINQDKPTFARALPNLRPSPDNAKLGQKRKHGEISPLAAHETELEAEKDYYGKPPPLVSHTKFVPQNGSIKLEHMEPTFAIKDESEDMSDSQLLEDAEVEEEEDDTGDDAHGFLSSSKTLGSLNDNLSGVDFVDDSDYSEALEFVQQDGQFLGEGSSSTGQHFMTAGTQEQKPPGKKKSGTSESRRFKCNTCGNQYNKYSHLNRHLQTHSDPRFQCDKCLKLFVRKDVLRRHLIEVHNVVVQNCKIK